MVAFRKQLLHSTQPKNIDALMKTITLPKGVTIKAAPGGIPPRDGGAELFDCNGDDLEEGELLHYEEDGDELLKNSCSTPSHADSTCVSLSNMSNNEEIFLDGVRALFDQHSNTSILFTPFMCQFHATYNRARSSIKKHLKTDPTSTVLKSLKETALEDEVSVPGPSTASNVEPLPGPSSISSPPHGPLSLNVGSFVLVKNGQNRLHACVVHSVEEDLAVQYYEQLPDGKFTPQECALSLLKEDVVKMLPMPNTSARGHRIYYEFTL